MSGSRIDRTGPILLGAALSMAGPALATSGWVVKGRGGDAYAGVASQAPGSRLRITCREQVELHLYPPPAWDGSRAFEVTLSIDGKRVPMDADATDRSIVLSDVPPSAIGITGAFRTRVKGGRMLVISGPPTRRIRPARLTFALEGAAAAIDAFERTCPAARTRRAP